MLNNSIITSLINHKQQSSHDLRHDFLVNSNEFKIISTIRKQLMNCDHFIISVAFITLSGVMLIIEELKYLEEKGINGQILTGDYLLFTDPSALKKLQQFNNIEIKMIQGGNLHAKGFFFRKKDYYDLIVGSSNLTQSALTKNIEWNFKVTSKTSGEIVYKCLEEFNHLFNNASNYNDIKDIYTQAYLDHKSKNNIIYMPVINEQIKPNEMQIEALNSLKMQRESNITKSLLISATGTGKTYLSAFDVKAYKPTRMLFIVHRTNIAEAALKTFKTLIPNVSMGIYSGKQRDDSDYLFATIQTINNDLDKFNPNDFDYIIIDEVHHASASSYKKVLQYFKPKFLLGMTATPERSDNLNIYELFDHNICYEIRLHQALALELLVPFHYYAISELIVNKEVVSKHDFNYLISEQRIKHIIDNIYKYGNLKENVKGLMFVSSIKEAEYITSELNKHDINAYALTGQDSIEVRNEKIKQLEDGLLEYIVTVDIFNEGIDIPKVNQIVMLRPTKSSIVYIQQLGRGLRLSENKEFVIILDFIGNYEENFLIPVALSQNNMYNKDDLKEFIINGTNLIPGESTVNFDQISKDTILKNINQVNFSTLKLIKPSFIELQKELGRVPMLVDFYKYQRISPSVILNYKDTYYDLLKTLKVEVNSLNNIEHDYLSFISKQFSPVKRVHEMLILKSLISKDNLSIDQLVLLIEQDIDIDNQRDNVLNALKHLSKEIFTSLSYRTKYSAVININNDIVSLSNSFKSSLESSEFTKHLTDLIDFNLLYVKDNYQQIDSDCIIKYKRYNKQEAFHYLNKDYNNGFGVSGYTTFKDSKECLIFITLDSSTSFTSYDNKLLNEQELIWYSKNNRVLSRNNKLTVEGEIANNNYTNYIFVKRTNSEEFYYLGIVDEVIEAVEINKLVKYKLKLKDQIEDRLYNFLLEEIND